MVKKIVMSIQCHFIYIANEAFTQVKEGRCKIGWVSILKIIIFDLLGSSVCFISLFLHSSTDLK